MVEPSTNGVPIGIMRVAEAERLSVTIEPSGEALLRHHARRQPGGGKPVMTDRLLRGSLVEVEQLALESTLRSRAPSLLTFAGLDGESNDYILRFRSEAGTEDVFVIYRMRARSLDDDRAEGVAFAVTEVTTGMDDHSWHGGGPTSWRAAGRFLPRASADDDAPDG